MQKNKELHKLLCWIISALILSVGIAFAISCVSIYQSGDRPFTPQSVASAFQKISILVYASIALTVIGLLMPGANLPVKALRDENDILSALQKRIGILPETEPEIQHRKRLKILFVILSAECFVYPAVYVLNGSHFTMENVNHDVLLATVRLAFSGILSLVLSLIYRHLERKSICRQIDICKAYLKENPGYKAEIKQPAMQSTSTVTVLRIAVVAAAVIFLTLGILNGGAGDVLKKAAAICTECIGLG